MIRSPSTVSFPRLRLVTTGHQVRRDTLTGGRASGTLVAASHQTQEADDVHLTRTAGACARPGRGAPPTVRAARPRPVSGGRSSDEQQSAAQVGRRLRAARARAGLSLRELAQRVGLRDHTVLIKYERGATPPSSARLFALARALDCSAAALLADRDEAMALIGSVDRADADLLAQLQVTLERLTAGAPEHPDDP